MTVLEFKSKKPKVQLRCSECGITQDAACSCRKQYEVIWPREAVTKYDKVHPGKTAKEAADATGTTRWTVGRVRNQDEQNAHPDRRVIGSDGKSYPMKTKKPKRKKEPQRACDPVLTKNVSVNKALVAIFDFVIYEGWSDYEFELFVSAEL